MGEARRRGTRAERIAQSIAMQKKEEPVNVPCKTCNTLLNGFEYLKSMPSGAAWQKTCGCGATTVALVQAKDSTLPRTFKSTLSMSDTLTGGDPNNKVSVSFLEKSPETIETGLIRLS